MSYKFLKASPNYPKTQQDKYIDLFQETLNRQFANASDVWTIEEETSFGSQEYENVEVRIVTHLISLVTGKPLGDDYKQLLFKDLSHIVNVGYLYKFDDNYWITINTEKIKNIAASSIVKRCNNTLRWIDLTGAVHEEPCSIDYAILQNLDYSGAAALSVIPSGTIDVICQYNDRINTIRPNQRFLFGNANNWTAYRVQGGGINNYNNMETSDESTVGLVRLTMKADYIGDNDDLTNGIAYENKQVYTVSLNQSTLAGIAGTVIQLYATVELNGSTITRDVEWASSDEAVATVNSTGGVTMVANGTATITCNLEGDANTKATASVTVSAVPSDNYRITISPDKNYILEGDTQVYTVYLYKNDIVQADTFTFTLDANTVPSTSYGYLVVSGNSFSVENKEKCVTDYLVVTCTSGARSKDQEINLRGSW